MTDDVFVGSLWLCHTKQKEPVGSWNFTGIGLRSFERPRKPVKSIGVQK